MPRNLILEAEEQKKQKKTATKKMIEDKKISKADKTVDLKKHEIKEVKSTRKTVVKKNSTKKVTIKKDSVKQDSVKKTIISNEYYDLPYRYNETIVKILAQTPNTLFIYWDISDKDRKNFIKKYGEDFFNVTKPVLIIKNETTGTSFEAEINDYANSWYLTTSNSDCKYIVELGRRKLQYINDTEIDSYIYVSHSNIIEVPNDHILLNTNQKMVYFMNTKTNVRTEKSIASLNFIKNIGRIYNIYNQMKVEDIQDNPSSEQMIFKIGEM